MARLRTGICFLTIWADLASACSQGVRAAPDDRVTALADLGTPTLPR